MTSEEIIALAFQCGIWIPLARGPEREQTIDKLRSFAGLVAQAEREACATICDIKWMAESYCGLTAMACAEEIRARGEK